MPVDPNLLNALSTALQDARSCGYDSNSRANDVFEGYTWSLVVRAAREEGAYVTYEDVYGNPTQNLVFRTSPGSISSRTQPYTHAVIAFPSCPDLEAHIGIMVAGRSKILHECDVAVLYRDEAASCRRQGVHPRASSLILAMECKFYASTLPLGLGRNFLGLAGEIHKKGRYLVSNSASPSISSLLRYHDIEWETDVTPQSKKAADLQKSFERSFRNYKAI